MNELIIAEDNPRDREYLADCLDSSYEITLTTNGQEAFEIAAKRSSPCIVTDLQMPLLNGIELARKIWQANSSARIVFWTQYRDEIYVRALTEIIPAETVYGFVLKNNPSTTLRRAIDIVFQDFQCWIDPKIRSVQALTAKRACRITDVEYEVLVDIALGLTDNMIAKRRGLTRRGAQSRLNTLYAKLCFTDETGLGETANSRTRAVAKALQRGLLNRHELSKEEDHLADWLRSCE